MAVPTWLLEIRRHSAMRRLGKLLEKTYKQWFYRAFLLFHQKPPLVTTAQMEGVHKILIVRPNFRIGNTLISLPLVAALRNRFPAAELDYLGADTTMILLRGMPLDQVFVMSRDFILKPWAYISLLRRLRQRKYDFLVQVGTGSFAGVICMVFLGARYRVGGGKWAEGLCNLQVDMSAAHHAYDDPVMMARVLDVPCRDRPCYQVTSAERNEALTRLEQAGFGGRSEALPFVALFTGGHQKKRWPLADWIQLAEMLLHANARVLVFIGPEEAAVAKAFRAAFPSHKLWVMDPLPLQKFAAVLAFSRLVVTPDTGPMHLAVALDVPTLAILQSHESLGYAPRGDLDRTLFRPEVNQVYATLIQHPVWQDVISEHS